MKRIDIRSPADGIVDQMSVFTVGGVINTAEPLMVIVPQDEQLVIEAKIAPQDIDQARSHTAADRCASRRSTSAPRRASTAP